MKRLKAYAVLACALVMIWSQVAQPYCAYALSAESGAISQSASQAYPKMKFPREDRTMLRIPKVKPNGMVTLQMLLVLMRVWTLLPAISLELML